ncbi:hypothetical protein INT47_011321, partial [Mucor saturninus]
NPHVVQCPICGQYVAATIINVHIDKNCPPPPPEEEPPATTTDAGALVSETTVYTPKETPPRLAPLFAPKPQAQTTLQRPTAPIFKSSNTTSSLKRTVETPPQPALKRNKRDVVSESMPLAAKVRPKSLTDFVGQEELLGKEGILKRLMDNDNIPSMILWGPPGCGKTTIARIMSNMTQSRFVELSATSHNTAHVKQAFDEAKSYLSLTAQKTIIFIDEIHRFTKSQQDLFLPYVEHGTIRLIGATTENPSFKVNSALLSRCKVFVLKTLNQDHIEAILTRGLEEWRGEEVVVETDKDKDAIKQLAVFSDGDARTALNTLEMAVNLLENKQSPLDMDTVKGAFQKSHLLYDRNGDQHYDIISALHKSIRGSDADAALYWLGRMLEAGEDPLYVARRLVRCASEDIGLADNTALPLAMATYQACEKIGMPECDTILAHLVVHLAETKKSVRSYKAYNLVKQTIQQKPQYPVPMHIRNAPTKLMENLGYGKGYKYNPSFDGPVEQSYLPDELKDQRFLDK